MFVRKLLSHSLIYSLGPQIPKIAGLFVLPIITQYLTTTDYGISGVIMSYVALFSILSDLGFAILLVNSYYNYPNRWKWVWRQLHFYLIVWSIFYGALLGVLLHFIMPKESKADEWAIIIYVCLPIIFFNSTQILAGRYYQFAQKPLYISIVSAIAGAAAILLNLVTIAYWQMGYMGWFLSSFIASLLQFLFFFYPVFFKYKLYPILAFRKRFLIRNLKVSLPMIPHNYATYLLNSSDRMVMDRYHLPIPQIGLYNMAYTFGNYFEFFGNAVGMAVGPFYTKLFARKNKEADQQVQFITNWLQISFILVGFLVSLWCKELMDILISNDELKSAYPIAIIITMGYVYRPYYWNVVNRLQFAEQTAKLWRISFIAGVGNLVLNIVLIPFFGVVAAAYTTFFALLYMGFAGYMLNSYKKIQRERFDPLMVIAAVIVSTAVVYLLKDTPVQFKVLITGLTLLSYTYYFWKRRTAFERIIV